MTSSLAEQLSKSASLNAALLADRSRRKFIESYLFTNREAERHDLDSIHALASNGFIQLSNLNQSFKTFESILFSDAVKSLDRTLLAKEESVELDRKVYHFLGLLGPYLLEAPTGKVLEWMVRQLRYVFRSFAAHS